MSHYVICSSCSRKMYECDCEDSYDHADDVVTCSSCSDEEDGRDGLVGS